jgi:hypothetical protein
MFASTLFSSIPDRSRSIFIKNGSDAKSKAGSCTVAVRTALTFSVITLHGNTGLGITGYPAFAISKTYTAFILIHAIMTAKMCFEFHYTIQPFTVYKLSLFATYTTHLRLSPFLQESCPYR